MAVGEGGGWRQRRIDAPGDLLRAEIQAALEGPLKVVPLLVEGASMPSKDELPVDIRDLANREALEVPTDFFHEAMARLIRNIEDSPRPGVPELKVFLGPDAGMLSDGWEMFLPQRTGIVTLPNGIAPWCEGRAWAFEQGGADYGSTRLQLDLVGSGSQPVQILERRARILSRRSRRPGVHRDRPARHRSLPGGYGSDVRNVDLAGDHLVPEVRDYRRDGRQPILALVGDQHPEMLVSR